MTSPRGRDVTWVSRTARSFSSSIKQKFEADVLENANSARKMLVIFVISISKLIDPARSRLKVPLLLVKFL